MLFKQINFISQQHLAETISQVEQCIKLLVIIQYFSPQVEKNKENRIWRVRFIKQRENPQRGI